MVIATLCLFVLACSLLGSGTNTFIKQKANASKTIKAILFLKEGGATVPISYQVSVIPYNNSLDNDDPGNVFTVDTDHGKTYLDSGSINFTWLSNTILQIDYDKKLRTFIMEQKVDDISVEYKAR